MGLSDIIARFRDGRIGELLITLKGRPVLRLKKRVSGDAKGLFVVPDDFNDALPPEIQRYFDGEEDDDL